MRWLITGAAGQLGSDLRTALSSAGVPDSDVRAWGSSELDVTDRRAIAARLDEFGPDVVVNAAAYTAVDAAESDADRAFAVNATAPALLAAAASERGCRLVHVSTDYVFGDASGGADRPFEVDDPTEPTSVYGRTKLAGEQAVLELAPEHGFVVRTAWVYGATGQNFVKTMAALQRSREHLDVVDDQRGSPTWSADLAAGLIALAQAPAQPGVYHCANGGETTWFGFARAIFAELGADPERVRPTTTDKFPRPAPRPAYSVLSDASWRAAGLTPLRHWRDALAEAFAVAGEQLRG